MRVEETLLLSGVTTVADKGVQTQVVRASEKAAEEPEEPEEPEKAEAVNGVRQMVELGRKPDSNGAVVAAVQFAATGD